MSNFETLLQTIPASAALPAHLVDLVNDARARDEHLARRKMIRRQLGGCECGHVRGEDVCLWCDLGMAIPMPRQELLEARAMMREFLETLAEQPRNRFERRRAASRRWRGC